MSHRVSEDEKLDHIHAILHQVQRGVNRVADLIIEGFKTMADKSAELQAALDDLANTVTEAVTEIEAQLKVVANPGTPDAAVDAALAKIGTLSATLKTEVANLKADNPPA